VQGVTPKVSVVIPIKGRPDLFELTAQSLCSQKFEDWEAIIVDDRSTEEDLRRISEIASEDRRMRVVAGAKRRPGASSARNAGLLLSAGEYVVFLDADDVLLPDCLSRRVQVMDESPDIDFAAFGSRMFFHRPGDSNLLWNGFDEGDDITRFLKIDAPWPTHGAIWRKSSLRRAGLLWDEAARSWQDWEFHIRALVAGLRGSKVPEVDCLFRMASSGSVSHASFSRVKVLNRARMLQRLTLYFERNGQDNEANRRMLAALLFRHAFSSGLRRKQAFLVWRLAYETGLVTRMGFCAVLFSRTLVWMAARTSRVIENFTLPDLPSVHQGTHLKATRPWIGPGQPRPVPSHVKSGKALLGERRTSEDETLQGVRAVLGPSK